MSEADKTRLTRNIIAGLPGAEEGYTIEQFRDRLADYDGIDKAKFRITSYNVCYTKLLRCRPNNQ